MEEMTKKKDKYNNNDRVYVSRKKEVENCVRSEKTTSLVT